MPIFNRGIDAVFVEKLNAEGDGETAPATRRIDFAALRPVEDGAEIVFYEAKLFSNNEIRAKGKQLPPVVEQIKDCGKLIVDHCAELAQSYRRVCGNLAALHSVKGRYLTILELMDRIASDKAALHVSEDVRLVVFGFDSDQRVGKAWKPHREKLENALGKRRLLLRGHPEGFIRGISPA